MEERISRKRFIRVGASVAGASVLAACGGGGGEGATTTASSGGGATTTAPESGGSGGATGTGGPGGEAIARVSEVPQNSAVKFTDAGRPAVLVHLQGGEFVAYSAVCTHQQCEVAYRKQLGQLACPCHGSLFDPANGGQVVNGPAEQPLPEIPVQVRGDQVTKA